MAAKGESPVLAKNPLTYKKYFACPKCGTSVGGFTITGSGEDDWGSYQHNFCPVCGQQITWSKTNWSDIYSV